MKVLKGIGAFFAVILSIVIFALSVGAIAVWGACDLVRPETLKNIVGSIDIAALVGGNSDGENEFNDTELSVAVTLKDGGIVAVPLDLTDSESDNPLSGLDLSFINEMAEAFGADGFNTAELTAVIQKEIVGGAFSVFAEGFENYIITGEDSHLLDGAALTSLLGNLKSTVETIYGREISTSAWENVEKVYEGFSESLSKELPTYAEVEQEILNTVDSENVVGYVTIKSAAGTIINGTAVLIVVIMIAVCCLLIALLRVSPYRWLCWSGIPIMIAGLLLLLPTLLGSVLVGFSGSIIGVDLSSAADALLGGLRTASLVFSVTGLGFIILYAILRSVFTKKVTSAPAGYAAATAAPAGYATAPAPAYAAVPAATQTVSQNTDAHSENAATDNVKTDVKPDDLSENNNS